MNKLDGYQTVAKAVRVEYNSKTNEVFLVFEILDEQLKQDIRTNWEKDLALVLDGKELKKF